MADAVRSRNWPRRSAGRFRAAAATCDRRGARGKAPPAADCRSCCWMWIWNPRLLRELAEAVLAHAPAVFEARLETSAREARGTCAKPRPAQPGRSTASANPSSPPAVSPDGEPDASLDYFSAAGESLECVEIARRIRKLAADRRAVRPHGHPAALAGTLPAAGRRSAAARRHPGVFQPRRGAARSRRPRISGLAGVRRRGLLRHALRRISLARPGAAARPSAAPERPRLPPPDDEVLARIYRGRRDRRPGAGPAGTAPRTKTPP